eukprot:TRINITY_DN93912_c0_g1_i1.p1 TRINITY_DN93912_c0_g1~~TRINITY_DN93912_c0_g1_i1.p1  ORF type:complete len:485 (+),score=102.26 TRINITY_DN93912_c0_g1_i1:2-1456(+)
MAFAGPPVIQRLLPSGELRLALRVERHASTRPGHVWKATGPCFGLLGIAIAGQRVRRRQVQRPARQKMSSNESGRFQHDNCEGSYRVKLEKEGIDWRALAGRTERAPKKTVALIIGYNGQRLNGFQMAHFHDHGDPLRTVESDIEVALLKAGAMLPESFGNLNRLGWHRVSRTDSGVSAACNVVTARLMVEEGEHGLKELVRKIREYLPAEIALHGANLLPSSFQARKAIRARSYEFLIPSYCVEPTLEVVRAVSGEIFRPGETPPIGDYRKLSALAEAARLREVRISPAALKHFREALACFEGTHFFGNFANGNLAPQAQQNWRTVERIACEEPIVDQHGREWLTVSIRGNSFVTHQIRKMVATAAKVVQGEWPMDFIHAALHRCMEVKTPRFPPHGLMFCRPHFLPTKRGAIAKESLALDTEELQGRIAAFQEQLHQSILQSEEDEHWGVWWLAMEAHYVEAEEMWQEVRPKFEEVLREEEA